MDNISLSIIREEIVDEKHSMHMSEVYLSSTKILGAECNCPINGRLQDHSDHKN